MKITVDYSDSVSVPILNIQSVKYLGDFVMRVRFNTNEEKLIDFKPFLENAVHPSVKKYYNETLFANYKIENGNLNWNDYDLIFPIGDLYSNSLQKYAYSV